MASSLAFEREFYRDIREKKKIGSNIYKAKGKRGYVGKLLTTVDLLKGKEKRKYTKPGEIKVSNVYKQLLPLDELQTYTPETQKKIVESWREHHTQKEIIKSLGCSKNIYFKNLYALEILDLETRENEMIETGDILSLPELKELPLEEQFVKLTEWNREYTAKQIGEYWGKNESVVHQLKYGIKKKLKKSGEYDQLDESLKNDYVLKKDKAVAISSNQEISFDKEQLSLVNNDAEEEKENNIAEMKELDYITADVGVSNINISNYEKNARNGLNDDFSDIKSLKEMIRIQSNAIENIMGRLDDLQEPKKEQQITFNPGDNRPIVLSGIGELEKVVNGNMTMNFNDEAEGFMLLQQIERFLTVLKKNPDNFKVSIELTKIDD